MPTSSPASYSPDRHRLLAFVCLALSMSLVGIYVALSKPLVAAFPVLLLAWLRFGIAAVAMLPWLRRPVDEVPMTPRVHALVFLESFLGNFMFSICMLYGVSMTSAIAAGVILAAIPAVVATASWLFLRERIGIRTGVAIGCAAIGIGLLAMAPASTATSTSTGGVAPDIVRSQWIGNALVFCAVLCEAAYAVIGKSLTRHLGPKRIASLINLWGFALTAPLGVWLAWDFPFSNVTAGNWLLLILYAMAASVWTVWLWMTGLRRVPASRAGVFTVFLPVSAAAVGVVVLGETLQAVHIAAFGSALLGVLTATWPAKDTRRNAVPASEKSNVLQ